MSYTINEMLKFLFDLTMFLFILQTIVNKIKQIIKCFAVLGAISIIIALNFNQNKLLILIEAVGQETHFDTRATPYCQTYLYILNYQVFNRNEISLKKNFIYQNQQHLIPVFDYTIPFVNSQHAHKKLNGCYYVTQPWF